MRARPTVGEERNVLLAGRAQAWCRSDLIGRATRDRIRTAARTHWRPSSLFSRIVFFVLTLVCVAAFFNLLRLTNIPAAGVLTAVVCIAIAESLILARRFFHIGPEEALYLGGLSAVVFDLRIPDQERLLLLAIAAVIAGWRVLNDFFFVAALAVFGFYLGARTNSGDVAAVYCVAVALLSLVFMRRQIARPMWARTLASAVFLLPGVAFLIAKFHPYGRGGVTAQALIGFVLLAVVMMIAGVVWRFHSAIFSSLIVVGLVISDINDRLEWRSEFRLLFWGGVALATGILLDRALRRPWRGITSIRLIDPGSHALLEMAAIGSISAPNTPPRDHRDGGKFGGGGASSGY